MCNSFIIIVYLLPHTCTSGLIKTSRKYGYHTVSNLTLKGNNSWICLRDRHYLAPLIDLSYIG